MNIREYIGTETEITAEQVRSLPVGAKVTLHSFDRKGEHQTLEATVVQSGKKKILKDGETEKPIRKETDRFCYTVKAQVGTKILV